MSSVICLLQPQHSVVAKDTADFWADFPDDDDKGDGVVAAEILDEDDFLPHWVLNTCGLPLTMMSYDIHLQSI